MLTTLSQNEKKSLLKISGSACTVSDGYVDEGALHVIRRNQFRFALGVGTFSDIHEMGEAIVLESRPYVTTVQAGVVRTETQEDFSTPFLVGLDAHQSAGAFLQYKASSPISLHSLYDKILHQHVEGFAIVGYAQASDLQSTYVKKAPIYKENINRKHSEYWARTCFDKNRSICFFGLVLPSEAKKKYPKELLSRLSYENPFQEGSAPFLNHTNVAVLDAGSFVAPKEMHRFLEYVKESPVVSVQQMLMQSMMQEGSFAIFPIGDIVSLEKTAEGPKEARDTLRYPYTFTSK